MLNTYCVRCGAVNHIGEENCVGCGANLTIQPAFATRDEPRGWQPFTDRQRPLRGIGIAALVTVLGVTLSLFTKNLDENWTARDLRGDFMGASGIGLHLLHHSGYHR